MKNVIVVLAVFVAGCSVSQTMLHPDGRADSCTARKVVGGTGPAPIYFHTSMALLMLQQCVDEMQEQGFVAADEPSSPASPTYSVTWKAPAGWELRPAETAQAVDQTVALYAINRTYKSNLLVSRSPGGRCNDKGRNERNALNLTEHLRLSANLRNAAEPVTIKGYQAYTFEMSGTYSHPQAKSIQLANRHFVVGRTNDILRISVTGPLELFKKGIEPKMKELIESLPIDNPMWGLRSASLQDC